MLLPAEIYSLSVNNKNPNSHTSIEIGQQFTVCVERGEATHSMQTVSLSVVTGSFIIFCQDGSVHGLSTWAQVQACKSTLPSHLENKNISYRLSSAHMGTSIAQDVHALQNFKLPSRIDLRSLKLPLHIDLRSLNCHYVFKKKN